MRSQARPIKNILFSACSLLLASQVSAGCISVRQPSVSDPNFQPLSLQFLIHATTKWDGLNNSSAIDQSFIETVNINSGFQQASDFCNNNTSITANVESSATSNTADVSDHFGRDFSIYPTTTATLKSTDAGWVTHQTPLGPSYTATQYSLGLSIAANDYVPIWNADLNQYIYANYTRTISFDQILEGYYSHPLNLYSYLQAQIGNNSFNYVDMANASIDQYGYKGAATLLSVTAVPAPATAWLFSSGLIGLIGAARIRSPKYKKH